MAGMSITFGWCITAFVTPLVRPSQLLIFLVHWDCTFLMLESGITSTDKTEWNEGIRNLRRIYSLYSPWMRDVSKLFSFSKKKIMNLLPDSLVVAGRVWQRECPRDLVGPVEIYIWTWTCPSTSSLHTSRNLEVCDITTVGIETPSARTPSDRQWILPDNIASPISQGIY